MPLRPLVVILTAVLTQACATGRESLSIDNWDDLDERQLGFVAGATTLREAEAAMREAKLTGVTTSQPSADVSVLAADYQVRVFVFEGGRFRHSLPIDSGAVLPFRYTLRVGRAGGRVALLVVYRDPREDLTVSAGPRAALFVESAGAFTQASAVSLASVAEAHGGLTRPLIVGEDFSQGVMFLARDREGAPWSSAYLLSLRGTDVVLAPMPMEEAARCSCVHDWVYGGTNDAS